MVFFQQPEDTEAVIGNTAYFPCTYNGTRGVPFWVVNESYAYPVNTLPPNHRYNGSGLIVYNVDIWMNGTKYQCCFQHLEQGDIVKTCSSEGTLTIISAGQIAIV